MTSEEELLNAIENKNIEKIKSILVNSDINNKILNLNEKNNINRNYPLLKAIDIKNIEIVKLLIEYANKHQIILNLNDINEHGNYPLLKAVNRGNVDIVKLLIEYANQHQIILNLNKKNEKKKYPIFTAIVKNYIEIAKLLIEYANQHQIILDINKRNGLDDFPIYTAIIKNYIEMVKLLMDYANQHHFILNLNEKYLFFSYPLTEVVVKRNNEMIKLLIEYANQNNFTLKYDKTYIRSLPNYQWFPHYSFKKSKKLIKNYEKEKKKEKNELELKRRERLESERIEKERLEKERMEMERLEKERLEKEQLEKEKIEKEKLEKEKLEKEKIKTPTLVIATHNFNREINFKENDFLIVTNWICEEKGYVYGHRKDNEKEKGIFPEIYIKIYKEEEHLENKYYGSEITPEYRIKFEEKINQIRTLDELNYISSKDFNLLNRLTNIEVHRNNLFNDAFISIMGKSPQELKKRLIITYIGEEGIDIGGLLSDFFCQISKEIGNPEYSLFKYSNNNSYELEINTYPSIVDTNHLEYYRFIGRIIGLAIFNQQHLNVSFSLLINKRLLNKSIEFSDLEYVDPDLFKSLQQIKNNERVEDLCLTFLMDIKDSNGNHKTIELKPNGANIDVTNSNKNEYIDLYIKNKFNDNEKFDALKKGFYEIIPENINSFIDEIDLKYLISGINIIDVDDWENNTKYSGYEKDDITIINFWKCVRDFSNENRIKLLAFATGNSQVPITGFKDLQKNGETFTIQKSGTKNDLPKSHTCFNRIELPPYPSLTIMKQKLLHAITEGPRCFTNK